jgi:DHA2 family multidrug resistance protein
MVIMARLLGKVDARLIASTGALLFAASMWEWSHFTTQSGQGDFFWPLILRGFALGLVFVPLNNLAMLELPMSKIAPATGIYNLMRQLGGSVGIALSATFVSRYGAQGRAALAEHVSLYNPVTAARLDQITHRLMAGGDAMDVARMKAAASLMGAVQQQATMISFERIFIAFGLHFLVAIPLILTLKWDKGRMRGGADAH